MSDSLLLMIAAQYYQQVCKCNDDYDCEESFFLILHEHSWTAKLRNLLPSSVKAIYSFSSFRSSLKNSYLSK